MPNNGTYSIMSNYKFKRSLCIVFARFLALGGGSRVAIFISIFFSSGSSLFFNLFF